jgi:glycosyltransferase involved in cell wall biosynthesis
MRLAVFTSEFPSRVATFFARDMRALLAAGVEVDIFPIYPESPALWRFVPDILNDQILPRNRVHHLRLSSSLARLRPTGSLRFRQFICDSAQVATATLGCGPVATAKNLYCLPKAWAWAREFGGQFDHVLAYWGNYAATCAHVFNRCLAESVPYSFFLHAGTDLYRQRPFMRQKLLAASRVIVVCEFNRRFLEQHYPDIYPQIAGKIRLHHLGVDLQELGFHPGPREPQRILAVGRLAALKGFDILIRAVYHIRQHTPVTLELIGDGEDAGRLRRMTRELGIEDAVVFRGWLPFDEVRKAMQTATLLAHPSAGIGDAVPTVIKEALALGLPVVASSVAGIPELLDDGRCGVLVPPQNPEILAREIEPLLKSPELRERYAVAGRAQAERIMDMWRNGRELAALLQSAGKASGVD